MAGRYLIGAANVHTWVAVITSGLPASHAASHASDVRVALRLVHSPLVEDIACHGAFSSHVDRIDIGIGVQWDLRCNSRVMFHKSGIRLTGGRTGPGIMVGMGCSCVFSFVSCSLWCPPLFSCVCGVLRCLRCDLVWDRRVDVGHIARVCCAAGAASVVLDVTCGCVHGVRPSHMRVAQRW